MMNSTKKLTEKAEIYQLWWMSRETGHRIHAGIAFYDDRYNEYRLKIDFLQALMGDEDARFYLRPVGKIDDRIYYRVETIVKKNGKFHARRLVGEGYSSTDTENEVYLDFGPVEKILVVSLDSKSLMKEEDRPAA
jgi:hypothetical protein